MISLPTEFLGTERLNIVTYNLREGHYTQLLSIVRPQSVGHSRLFTPSLATHLDIFPGYFPYISPLIPLFTTQNTNSHTMPQQYGCVVMEMNGVELKIIKYTIALDLIINCGCGLW